jgi:hypothetical protein
VPLRLLLELFLECALLRRRVRVPAALNIMGATAVGFLLAWFICGSSAFPLYYSANGSVLLTSTFGGNMTLRPDGGGAIVATSVIAAQGGVALNNTLLTEQLVSELLAQKGRLQPPLCMPPGGDRLLYNGTAWVCLCQGGWTGVSCTVSPTPPPPNPSPPSPPPPNPPPLMNALLVDGLEAWYSAKMSWLDPQWNDLSGVFDTQWNDLSGNQRHLTMTSSGNQLRNSSLAYIYPGSLTLSVRLAAEYTICTVSRQTAFTATSVEKYLDQDARCYSYVHFLNHAYFQGMAGVAGMGVYGGPDFSCNTRLGVCSPCYYYGGCSYMGYGASFPGPTTTNQQTGSYAHMPDSDWIYACSTNTRCATFVNGINRCVNAPTFATPPQVEQLPFTNNGRTNGNNGQTFMYITTGGGGNGVAEVLFWNRSLQDDEIGSMNFYFETTYGFQPDAF